MKVTVTYEVTPEEVADLYKHIAKSNNEIVIDTMQNFYSEWVKMFRLNTKNKVL